jgi:exopolysaccharide biosynthesis polyprenyl glycosylphosphotransferase
MLKEKATILRRVAICTDACIAAGAFYLGHLLRELLGHMSPLHEYIWILPVFVCTWVFFLYIFDIYNSFRAKTITEILTVIAKSAFLGFVAFGVLTYILKIENVSRAFIYFIFLISAVCIALEKVCLIFFFRRVRQRGFNFRNILIIGTGKRAQKFVDTIRDHKDLGFVVTGLVDEDASMVGKAISGCKVLGTFNDLTHIIHKNVIDDVVFVVPRSWLGRIEELMQVCEREGIRIHIAVDFFELKLAKAKQTDLRGLPLLTFETTPDQIWHLLIKRFFDVVVSGISLLLLSPVFAIIALLIKLTSSGPVFFRQQRCSLNSRQFTLYKFRTMVMDAESRLKDIMHHNEMDGPVFKMANDPRLTRIGNFLRRSSLDELPQLWNVFKGDMSLVGPRPPIPAEVVKYDNWQRRRLSMKPGITCLWQVNGRNKIVDFNEWMRLDLEYIDNWSLYLDLKIFLKTIPAVLFGIGAK